LLAGQVLGHDGRLLHPTVMPYEFYRSMSDEDLASVIVYLRSSVPTPDLSTPVKRGAYLVQLGACRWCHTLRDANRKPLPGWSSQAET
jgi:hypothetical protein